MRILLSGADGLLGKSIQRRNFINSTNYKNSENNVEIIALGRKDLDICSKQSIEAAMEKQHPDWVINCAAATDVDRCESDRRWAIEVNARGARLLAESCRGNCGFLHVSTDFVFDGKKNSPYTESDICSPISVYGASKRLGECSVIENDGVVVRTQWLYGREKKGFVDWILGSDDNIKVINDCFGSPTNAEDLGACILDLVNSEARGIYHVANSGTCSRADFTEAILLRAGKTKKIEHVSVHSLNLAARRPYNSALISERGIMMRSWQEALAAYFENQD